MWGFVQKIPESLSEQHDSIIRLKSGMTVNTVNIDKNSDGQREASIERKAMAKAVQMLSGDVKHLTKAVEDQSGKIDTLGGFWMEYKRVI